MFNTQRSQTKPRSGIGLQPASQQQIDSLKNQLIRIQRNYLNYIAALLVLAAGVSVRTLSLDFELGVELFEAGVNIGLWIGLFAGFMANGERSIRLKIAVVSVIVSISAGVFVSMLLMLYQGYMASWILSVNILASSVASLWVLTCYDEVVQGLESLKLVNDKQFEFFEKAAQHFDELKTFSQKISQQGRRPLIGEYWAVLDWIHNRANMNKH